MNTKPIEIIVAATPDGEIGYKNTIPWRLKGDLKRFKQLTMGNILLMGKHTYESLPGPLEGRTVIVVSQSLSLEHRLFTYNPKEAVLGDVVFAPNVQTALLWANQFDHGETIFIAGGAGLYENFLAWPAVKVHLTTVYKESANGYDTVIKNFNVLDQFEVIGDVIEVYDTIELPPQPIPPECMGAIVIPMPQREQLLSHTYTTLVSPQYHSVP